MKRRFPLFTTVLSLAFLNLCLLGLVFALFARIQFRLDTSVLSHKFVAKVIGFP